MKGSFIVQKVMPREVVLFAVRLQPDRTSGGLCTWKYAMLLSRLGSLRVVSKESTREEETGTDRAFRGDMAERVEVVALQGPGRPDNVPMGQRAATPWIVRKGRAAIVYATGFAPQEWGWVRAWREYAKQHLTMSSKERFALAFGAGMDFTPHMALASLARGIRWVAYYHDPWPGHLYPEPYRWKRSIPGWHQERWHRRILRRAPALAFPSERLRDWVLCGDLAPLRAKAFILPHLASGPELPMLENSAGLPEAFKPSDFNVVHAGTLLRHRSPWALLSGFSRFASRDAERAERAKLWLVGWVDRHLAPDPRWGEMTAGRGIHVINDRVSYEDSMRLLFHATAGVIVEAVAAESPFYPGKLADLLYLRKPILAVTPARSTVRDMLGDGYPLLCGPDCAEEVERKLELLWEAWRERRSDRYAPSERAVEMASPGRALREIERIGEFLRC